MIAYHRSQAADATVAVYSVPRENANRFGILDLDSNGRMVDFQEKPDNPRGAWASMGVYVFNKDVLVEQLQADADMGDASAHDFGKDIIPRIFKSHRVFGYQYQSYWRDVGTIESYWSAHMDMIAPRPSLNLEEADLKLRTAGGIMPPARFGREASVRESMISPAAVINGEVTRSVISPGVIVEEGAIVRDSIIQHKCIIRAGAIVDRSILDKEVTVGRGAVVGEGDQSIANFDRPDIVNSGINVIGKRVEIPAGLHVGRNVVIGPGVRDELVGLETLASGSSIHPVTMPLHLFV